VTGAEQIHAEMPRMPGARGGDVRLFPCANGLAQVALLAGAVHTAQRAACGRSCA
jgi:hypothetical protein